MTNLLLVFLLLATQLPTPLSATQVVGYGYKLVSLKEFNDISGGLVGLLELKQPTSTNGPDIPRLKLFVKHETEGRLRVYITDADKDRWEIPYDLLPRERPLPLKKSTTTANANANANARRITATTFEYPPSGDLTFSFTKDPFGFAVRRTSTGETLFNSTAETHDPYGNMVFKDQYLEITTRLPATAHLYGLGENTQPGGIRVRPNDPYTIYTTDISAIRLNMDLYGAHPVYMDVRGVTSSSGTTSTGTNTGGGGGAAAHGVLLLNSNGMDVVYRGDSLTYKVIGGVLDFYFFGGPTPLKVVDQYTALVGRPAAMPYWALGFHQCRWGYHNVSEVETVVDDYDKAGIPLDVIWTDDDHMDAAKDFTLDPVNFPRSKFVSLIDKVHNQLNMRYVVLIDPGIAVNHTYGVFHRAMAKDVFIKHDGEPYLAQVWPGPVYFPDFLNPDGVSWWADEIRRFLQLAPLDGLWVDMNEPSNFCTGKCHLPTTHPCPVPNSDQPWLCCLDCKNITSTRFDDPPYRINASGVRAPLGTKTIAASAKHYNGVREYDAHSLYGFTMARATHDALRSIKRSRPFVLTRSTFVGSGKYAAHWTGDNKGTWDDLRYSISTLLNFGIFGIPMVGADICGFYPAPTEELCNRWIELGAFYPFSRDHANYYSPRQELYVWETVAKSARNALGMRYKLLPYLYTLSYEAHTTGAPIARPVFFSFPGFSRGYELSTQFLLGRSVMVSPVLKKAATVVKALFPPGTWYNLFDMTRAVVSKDDRYHTLEAPLNEINVHVYEGTVLPMQRGGVRSHDARRTPFTLVVAFGINAVDAEAVGEVFVDDDEQTEMELAEGKATHVEFKAKVVGGANVSVWSEARMGEFAVKEKMVVERVRVLGLRGSAGGLVVKVEGKEVEDNGGAGFVEASPPEVVGLERLEGDTNQRALVVDLAGLELSLGRSFAMNWRMALTKN